jgi:hypothetical protein
VSRPQAPLLIVASDADEATALRGLLDAPLSLDSPPESADLMLSASLLGGMVVGISVPASLSRPLVRAYVQHQPQGRVVVLCNPEDITTLTAFAFRDARVELFFTPWRVETVRDFLGVQAGALA